MRKTILFVITLTLVSLLLSACAGQGLKPVNGGIQPLSGSGGGDPQIEVPPDGNRPPPGSEGGNVPAQGNAPDSGNINSQGTPVAGVAGDVSGEPGLVEANPGEGDASSSTEGDDNMSSKPPEGWLTYTDEKYGFSISYPDTYVILPEVDPRINVGVQHQVRFQDAEIAKSESADLEPPKFIIEVYKNPKTDLNKWIQSSRLATPDAAYESVTLAGAKYGVKVTLKSLVAPNVTYYYATEDVIYRLVPLGEYSEQMLKSFTLAENIHN